MKTVQLIKETLEVNSFEALRLFEELTTKKEDVKLHGEVNFSKANLIDTHSDDNIIGGTIGCDFSNEDKTSLDLIKISKALDKASEVAHRVIFNVDNLTSIKADKYTKAFIEVLEQINKEIQDN